MKRQLILLTLLLTSCNYFNSHKQRFDKVGSYKIFFYDNKEVLEEIVNRISKDEKTNVKIGQRIDPIEFDELTTAQLRRFEIEYVEINKTSCEQFKIEFTTSWTEHPIGQMYLTKDCPDEKSTKDNYWTDGKFIEVWGLGDGWVIWVDSDFI